MRRRGRLPLLAALLLAACGGVAGPAPRPTPAPTPPLGWTRLVDSQAGFSVLVPRAWEAVRADDPKRDAALAAITISSAPLGAFMTQALAEQGAAQVAAVLADRASVGRTYIDNFVVLRSDLGPTARAPTLEAVAQGKLQRAAAQEGLKAAPTRSRQALPAGEAEAIDYSVTLDAGREAEVRMLLLTSDRGGRRMLYELLLAHLATGPDGPALNYVAASFQLT